VGLITTSVHHSDRADVNIKVDPNKNNPIKEISIVGRLNTKYANIKDASTMDIVDVMDSLTPTANSLFKNIKDNLDYRTNEATLKGPHNKSEQKSRSNATKVLKNAGVVKKIGQRSFIVNPYLIVPPGDFQKDIVAKWESLP